MMLNVNVNNSLKNEWKRKLLHVHYYCNLYVNRWLVISDSIVWRLHLSLFILIAISTFWYIIIMPVHHIIRMCQNMLHTLDNVKQFTIDTSAWIGFGCVFEMMNEWKVNKYYVYTKNVTRKMRKTCNVKSREKSANEARYTTTYIQSSWYSNSRSDNKTTTIKASTFWGKYCMLKAKWRENPFG